MPLEQSLEAGIEDEGRPADLRGLKLPGIDELVERGSWNAGQPDRHCDPHADRFGWQALKRGKRGFRLDSPIFIAFISAHDRVRERMNARSLSMKLASMAGISSVTGSSRP